jgi:hypothetical protein
MSFSVVCRSQEVKQFPPNADGSIPVEIDGQKYLAITASQLKSWLKLQVDVDALQQDAKELQLQIATLQHEKELLQKDVTIANQSRDSALKDLERSKEDTARAQEDAKRNFGLLIGERQLRIEAQQFVPHSSGGALGKFLAVFDHPAAQAGFKLVIPTITMFRTASCK